MKKEREPKGPPPGRPNVDPRFLKAREEAGDLGKTASPPRDDENQVKTPIKAPRAPASMKDNKAAKKKWRQLSKTLIELKTLGATDFDLLEQYCLDYSEWLRLNDEIGTSLTIKTSNGNTIQNPALSIRNQLAARMQRCREQLGMTPATRSKITKTTAPGQKDLLNKS